MENNLWVSIRNILDGKLKFPNLKKGGTGIQIGFDLSSTRLTTDLIVMARRVGATGRVIAIDPDPINHKRIKPIINLYQLPITLVQKGTYSERTKEKLYLANRSSWNRIGKFINGGNTDEAIETIAVELDTVDSILKQLNQPINQIKHVNITNNGAEYHTLLGMSYLLDNTSDLCITLISGRPAELGIINGKSDREMVTEHLQSKGFTVHFYWNTQLFWWNIVHRMLIKKQWRFWKKTFGVVIAHKGKARHPWYQSFS